MPSKDLVPVLVTPADRDVIMTWARQAGKRSMSEIVSELVELKRDSVKRRIYARNLRQARSRLHLD
jgi:hypothetical protein